MHTQIESHRHSEMLLIHLMGNSHPLRAKSCRQKHHSQQNIIRRYVIRDGNIRLLFLLRNPLGRCPPNPLLWMLVNVYLTYANRQKTLEVNIARGVLAPRYPWTVSPNNTIDTNR